MNTLLYKEFRLAISPLFYLMLLFATLLLIPQWIYFLATMYFFFITVPNLFTTGKAQNDIVFTAMLPVRRNDIVKARVLSVVVLEVLQILATAAFAAINIAIYPAGNFLLDPNAAYIGFTFAMFGIFNAIFFPMFYRTAYKIAAPVIVALTAATLFAAGVEFSILAFPALKIFDGRVPSAAHFAILAGGIVAFAALTFLALRLSVRRFERVNI